MKGLGTKFKVIENGVFLLVDAVSEHTTARLEFSTAMSHLLRQQSERHECGREGSHFQERFDLDDRLSAANVQIPLCPHLGRHLLLIENEQLP